MNDRYVAYLKGYFVATIVMSMSLLVHPIPELVEVLASMACGLAAIAAMGRVKGYV